MEYLSVTLDKAQAFRNIGAKHSSALLVLEKSTLHFILTATPLQTSVKDLCGMGCLIGQPFFFTKEALAEERDNFNATWKTNGKDPDAKLNTMEAVAHQI
ncbi:hypothetical protein H0H87_009983 [Tephrocybe sp. NHM501043]|nr:hypothetical protein H0H87_009983 [Tephrocybe sp. NHM501043]